MMRVAFAAMNLMAFAPYALASVSVSAQQHHHKQPSSAYNSVSSKVSALEARLSEIEVENKQKLADRFQKYQAKLQEQQQTNVELAADNVALSKRAGELHNTNQEMVKLATELQHDNELWEADWSAMQKNLSTALELTSNSLNGIDNDRNSKDFDVLKELKDSDERAQASKTHAHRLDEVASSHRLRAGFPVSLLSFGASPNPRSILKILDAGLEDLAKEYKDKQAELDARYEELFKQERAQHEDLAEEHYNLEAKIAELTKLQIRIQAAVQHLQESNKMLERQAGSLRMYAQRLGIRALPHHHGGSEVPPSKPESASSPEEATRRVASQLRKPDRDFDADAVEETEQNFSVRSADRSPKNLKTAFFSWITG